MQGQPRPIAGGRARRALACRMAAASARSLRPVVTIHSGSRAATQRAAGQCYRHAGSAIMAARPMRQSLTFFSFPAVPEPHGPMHSANRGECLAEGRPGVRHPSGQTAEWPVPMRQRASREQRACGSSPRGRGSHSSSVRGTSRRTPGALRRRDGCPLQG